MSKHRRIEGFSEALLLLPLLAMLGYAWTPKDAADGLADIEISFKVDSRLTKGLYMGDRWVSVPNYNGTAGQDTVDARVRGLDAAGAAVAIHPRWVQADPEMVTVSPSEGSEVKITVKRAGESRVRVTSGVVSKVLAIKAAYKEKVLQVEIAQLKTEAPAGVSTTPAFKSEQEKLSYALGMSLVSQLRTQGVQLDADSYVQGFRDALSGRKPLLTEPEARAALMGMQSGISNQAEKRKELAEKNMNSGEAFLAENKTKDGIISLENGLQYKILKAGEGGKPALTDTVVCHYRGTLIDGVEFDSSYKRGKPATFSLNRVIKGWSEALQLMPVGSRWQLFIPPQLAYGERGAPGGRVGPNATLIFEVELVSIQDKSQDVAAGHQLAAPRN